tara:strand:+ start:108 stop:524 length:417 start_codon:yes stop_codon:yes gene_type:complete
MVYQKLSNVSFTSSKGFTLIEILVVMFIIVLLASLVGPNLWNQADRAEQSVVLPQIRNLENTLATYRMDIGEFPDTLNGLMENESNRASWNGPYIPRIPLDPWGNEYIYDSNGREFTLGSYGPDGERGGEGDDADIGF